MTVNVMSSNPHYVLECLNNIAKGEAIICTGVGQHQMWAAQYLDYKHPRTFLTSGSMGTMGFGLPAAIGAQFARPDRLVVNIDGDGSLRMNFGEMETVSNYNLGVKSFCSIIKETAWSGSGRRCSLPSASAGARSSFIGKTS